MKMKKLNILINQVKLNIFDTKFDNYSYDDLDELITNKYAKGGII